MKTCCVIGHKSNDLPLEYKKISKYVLYLVELKTRIDELIKNGYSHFICGGINGVDFDFAKIIIDLKINLDISLEIVIEYENQDLKWGNIDKVLYRNILKSADTVTNFSIIHKFSKLQTRHEYIVNYSDIVLAVWNGIETGRTYNTIKQAQNVKKNIIFILL